MYQLQRFFFFLHYYTIYMSLQIEIFVLSGEGNVSNFLQTTITEDLVKSFLPDTCKFRWEESDDKPYTQNAVMELQTLYCGSVVSVAHAAEISKEVSPHGVNKYY